MNINRGLKLLPSKVVVYGPEGIGKTTFISQFPDPLFCDVEGGSGHLDVNRTDVPTSWEMLLGIVREVIANPSVCRTFCIDTADWAERMCIKQVCDKHNQQGIETFGYGKGYVYVYEAFGSLLDLLSELPSRGVIPVLTAHAQLQKVEQPDEMGSYDHYTLKLSKKTGKNVADMVKEWADLLLFANYKTFVVNVDGLGAAKGKNKAQGGKRVMYTSHTPSWDAKNRCGLPDELPFEYAAIGTVIERACAVQNSPVRVPDVRTQQTAPETVKAPSAPLQSQDSAIPASAPTATAELSPDIRRSSLPMAHLRRWSRRPRRARAV